MLQQEEKTKWTGRRILVYGIIGMLLFGLPAMSYIYLKKGFDWRVEAQSELKDFGKVPSIPVVWQDGSTEDQIDGKLCVIYNFGNGMADLTPANKNVLDIGEELVKQFGYKPESIRNDFRMVLIRNGETPAFQNYKNSLPSAELSNWVSAGGVNSWNKILSEGFNYYCTSSQVTPYPNYLALADTAGVIRRFYNANDKSDIDRMVQQIAIIIPKQFKK